MQIKHKCITAQYATTSRKFHTACHLHRNLYNWFFTPRLDFYRLSSFFFTMFTKCLYMVVCRKLYTVFKFVLLQMFYVCVRPPLHLALWCCVVAVCCKDFAWRGSRSNNTQITRKWSGLLTDLEREKKALGRSTSHACNAILPFFVRFCLLCHSRECFVADNALPVTSPRVMTKACWGREKMLACNLTHLRARVMLKR